MGTWGFGPFDSDEGLDVLAAIRTDVSSSTEEGRVDQQALRRCLSATMGSGTHAERYACAGLVLAVSRNVAQQGATSLSVPKGERGDVLSYAPWYTEMLDPATADALAEQSVRTCRDLAGDDAWLATWFDRDGVTGVLTTLAGNPGG